ncbi:MAG: hypothetical protein ACXWP5_04260, partial [Bdellovibrionota bacterium]
FEDPTGTDHDRLGEGLRRALYNYMLGVGFEMDVRVWFGKTGKGAKIPKSKVAPDLIARAIS